MTFPFLITAVYTLYILGTKQPVSDRILPQLIIPPFFPLFSKKLPNISGEEIKKPYRLEQIIRIKEDYPLDLADFVSKASIKVPETTFNNMHGRLKDLSTEDGNFFAAKAGNMGK